MSTVRGPRFAREHPRVLTAVLTVVGYVVVVGTLYGDVGLYPEISESTVDLFSAVIAVVNSATIACLAAGWYWIRNDEVDRHRMAMTAAFALIVLFLVFYLLKTGGGGRKEFVGPTVPYYAYLAMLGIHILLSFLSVPLVLYNVVTGVTHTTAELRATPHARVGRVSVVVWSVSLTLGVLAYVLLNHVYTYEFVEMTVVPSLP